MPTALWIYGGKDPYASGEVRRIGLPALLVETSEWTSRLCGGDDAAVGQTADLVVCALHAAAALACLPVSGSPPIVIEVDLSCVEAGAPLASTLHALSNRIAAVVARSPRAAQWAERVLAGMGVPVVTIPDPAARSVELAAVALRFGLSHPEESPTSLPADFDLWFAEPGDVVEDAEVEGLRDANAENRRLVVVAPSDVRAWLSQAGIRFEGFDWSAQRLELCIARARRHVFAGRPAFSQLRRRMIVQRAGVALTGSRGSVSSAHRPAEVGRRWSELLASLIEAPVRHRGSGEVLMFLDLVQDLDLALPLVDEALRRSIPVRVVISTWLQRRSPRVVREMKLRDLAVEAASRESIVAGEAPILDGALAVVSPAESSLSAHERAHVLFRRARDAGVPTFSLQHGVENVGLAPTDGGGEEPSLLSDHLFVWSASRDRWAHISQALRPRLVHVGRRVSPPRPIGDVRAALAGFKQIVVVFENLHWDRYDRSWRNQFVADCLEFAAVDPERCVVLKPHHAGLWSIRHTHLFPQWPQNLVLADPTDPFWEPFTAPSLLELADAVITTPSTVALDAAQAGKPVAIAAYGLDLAAYSPLTLLHSLQDWLTFAANGASIADAQRRAIFLAKTSASGSSPEVKMVDRIVASMEERRGARRRRARMGGGAGG